MSSCGLEHHFYFEIGVILVIALIVYIFVFIALGVGKYLWHIQDKINRHDLSIGDRNCAPVQFKDQQRVKILCTDCDDLRSKKTVAEEEARKLRDEKSQLRAALVDVLNNMETISIKIRNGDATAESLTLERTDENTPRLTTIKSIIMESKVAVQNLLERIKRAL